MHITALVFFMVFHSLLKIPVAAVIILHLAVKQKAFILTWAINIRLSMPFYRCRIILFWQFSHITLFL
jgi:hypothetical protein